MIDLPPLRVHPRRDGLDVARGDSRIEAGPPRGRRVRRHAAVEGALPLCARDQLEARQRLGFAGEIPNLEPRGEPVGSEDQQLDDRIRELSATLSRDAEIGVANEEGIGLDRENLVGAHVLSAELELAAPLSEVLVCPARAPEVKAPMVDQLDEPGRRGRHAFHVEWPVPPRDRTRRCPGTLTLRSLGEQRGVALVEAGDGVEGVIGGEHLVPAPAPAVVQLRDRIRLMLILADIEAPAARGAGMHPTPAEHERIAKRRQRFLPTARLA